jgi:hypothetical protein
MNGKEQARLLGILLWVLTGLQLGVILLIGLMYTVIFGAVFATAPPDPHGPPPALIGGIMIFVMGFILVTSALFSIPKIVAGYGLRKEKSWAKIWAIIACIMACMNFPLGTAVGVYGLVFIFGDAGRAYFDGPQYGRFPGAAGATPPPPNSWQ